MLIAAAPFDKFKGGFGSRAGCKVGREVISEIVVRAKGIPNLVDGLLVWFWDLCGQRKGREQKGDRKEGS